MSAYTANSMYGFDPTAQQPTASPDPDHQGRPEPTMATTAVGGRKIDSPVLALVVVLGVVVVLTQLSFRGTINVSG